MAAMSGGHTNFAVNQMKAPNATACMTSVKLISMVALGRNGRCESLADDRKRRIAEREQHRKTHADDERSVDKTEEQEYLGLQLQHQLRLPRCAFEKARAHDAHADTC